MGAPDPSGFSSMVGIQSELWKRLMQVGWKDAFNYSMSWFECTWFNDNDLEFLNQLWLHFFQWNFIFGLTTTLVEFDLFYLMALSGFRVDFFLCCSIKNQFNDFFFFPTKSHLIVELWGILSLPKLLCSAASFSKKIQSGSSTNWIGFPFISSCSYSLHLCSLEPKELFCPVFPPEVLTGNSNLYNINII